MPLRIAQPVIDSCVGAVRRMLVVHSFMIDGHLHHGALEAALVEMGFESSSPTARVFLRLFQDEVLDRLILRDPLPYIQGIIQDRYPPDRAAVGF